jgi:hypothetical protein
MKSTAIILSIFSVLMFNQSCKKETTPQTFDCAGVAPTYNGEIKAILNASCATQGCHSASSNAAGRNYSTYSAAKSNASSDAFLGSIQHLSGYSAMPKGASKLSDANIKLLSCWKQNGFPE